MKNRLIIGVMLAGMLTAFLGVAAQACTGCGCSAPPKKAESAKEKESVKAQTVCPVMGGKINKNAYVDVKGSRVYVCCRGCIAKIKADPDKYLAKIKANGETPEKAPAVLCGKCGEIKGTKACCVKDAPKCKGCGLIKGSPGCCKLPEKGKDAALCGKCGQIKGTADCCKKEAKKCGKCGLAKGSPGCCKLK